MADKPILFNTDMVKAILDGRKTQTRRVCKGQPQDETANPETMGYKPPYKPGDILWVRETWCALPVSPGGHLRIPERYYYKADPELRPEGWRVNWKPSIHMPREAARLFLRVNEVRIERVQNITPEDAGAEGVQYETDNSGQMRKWLFRRLWDDTIKKADLPLYGWIANPWVWVIEFERLDGKPAGLWADMDTAQYADQDVLMPAT